MTTSYFYFNSIDIFWIIFVFFFLYNLLLQILINLLICACKAVWLLSKQLWVHCCRAINSVWDHQSQHGMCKRLITFTLAAKCLELSGLLIREQIMISWKLISAAARCRLCVPDWIFPRISLSFSVSLCFAVFFPYIIFFFFLMQDMYNWAVSIILFTFSETWME